MLYADLANTIDGGEFATPDDVKKSLLGCGEHGGLVGVRVNTSDPVYSSPEYKASGARSSGMLVKIVRALVEDVFVLVNVICLVKIWTGLVNHGVFVHK